MERFSYCIEDSDRFCKRLGSLLYTTRLFSTVLLLLIYYSSESGSFLVIDTGKLRDFFTGIIISGS